MDKEDRASEVLEFSVSSSKGFDFLVFAVGSLYSGIELLMTQRPTGAFSVSFKYLGDLDALIYGLLVYTLKPELEILFCICERATSKDCLEVLS